MTKLTHCSNCGKKLELVFDEAPNSAEMLYANRTDLELVYTSSNFDSEQYENALVITFGGGYEMFIDPIEEYFEGRGDLYGILCHKCAHELCDRYPWIKKLIDPTSSHAHSYNKDWTNHEGWDLPHKKHEGGQCTCCSGE